MTEAYPGVNPEAVMPSVNLMPEQAVVDQREAGYITRKSLAVATAVATLLGGGMAAGFAAEANAAPAAYGTSYSPEDAMPSAMPDASPSASPTSTSTGETGTFIHLSAEGKSFDNVKEALNVKFGAWQNPGEISNSQQKKLEKHDECGSFGDPALSKEYYPKLAHISNKYGNHYKNLDGSTGEFDSRTPIEACKNKLGQWIEVSKNGISHHCGNVITAIKHHTQKVIEIVSFKKKLNMDIHAESHATASCEIDTPYGKVSASGEGFGEAGVKETVTIGAFVKSHGKNAMKIFASYKEKAFANAKSNAKADCEEKTPPTSSPTPSPSSTPTPTPTPSHTPNPAELSVNHVQEVYASTATQTTYNTIEATVDNATVGDTENICFTADYGKFAQHCIQQVVTSPDFKVDDVYASPTESGITENISVSAYDMTNGTYANPNPFTESFPVDPQPVTVRP